MARWACPVAAALTRLAGEGVTTFEVTAIERDGGWAARTSSCSRTLVALDRGRIIASGGIRSVDDLLAVRSLGAPARSSAAPCTTAASTSARHSLRSRQGDRLGSLNHVVQAGNHSGRRRVKSADEAVTSRLSCARSHVEVLIARAGDASAGQRRESDRRRDRVSPADVDRERPGACGIPYGRRPPGRHPSRSDVGLRACAGRTVTSGHRSHSAGRRLPMGTWNVGSFATDAPAFIGLAVSLAGVISRSR